MENFAHHRLPTQEEIKDLKFIGLSIDKEETRRADMTRLGEFLQVLKIAGKNARSKAMVTFEYDDDPREAYTIPEIRKYVAAAVKKYPELFYFISLEGHGNFQTLIMCLMEITRTVKQPNGNTNVNLKRDPLLIMHLSDTMINYAASIKDEELNEIDKIINAFTAMV